MNIFRTNSPYLTCLTLSDAISSTNLLGKFAQLPDHHIQCRLLVSWVQTHFNLGKTYVYALQHILDDRVPNGGHLASWLPLAQSWTSWELLSHDWIEQWTAATLLYYGHHLMLGPGIIEHKYA